MAKIRLILIFIYIIYLYILYYRKSWNYNLIIVISILSLTNLIFINIDELSELKILSYLSI